MVDLTDEAMRACLGAEIRAAREELGISQTELGKLIGVKKGGISKIETGVTAPLLYDYVLIMHYLLRGWQPKGTDHWHPAIRLYDHFNAK